MADVGASAPASSPARAPTPETAEVTQQALSSDAVLQRLNALERELAAVKAEQEARVQAGKATPGEPSPKELAQNYGTDEEATDALSPDEARSLFSGKVKDFKSEDLIDYAVRGPYLVGVLADNGEKVVVEHGKPYTATPQVGQLGRAQTGPVSSGPTPETAPTGPPEGQQGQQAQKTAPQAGQTGQAAQKTANQAPKPAQE